MAGSSPSLSPEERAAVKARARELKQQATRADQKKAFDDAVSDMPPSERELVEGLHDLIAAKAPALHPKTMYGMPAWADGDDKVVCFFQGATKSSTRYSTFGFQPAARLDDGEFWPTAFAIEALSPATKKTIAALVEKAVAEDAP